jgi:hypothetical protein
MTYIQIYNVLELGHAPLTLMMCWRRSDRFFDALLWCPINTSHGDGVVERGGP